jgi:hypothetical protein
VILTAGSPILHKNVGEMHDWIKKVTWREFECVI